jgi:hypothetical protein
MWAQGHHPGHFPRRGAWDTWRGREVHEWDALPVPFLGRSALIANTRACGRRNDLADLEALGEADKCERRESAGAPGRSPHPTHRVVP